MFLSPTNQQTPSGGGMPTIPSGARMPIPGNAEFAVYLLMWIVLAIVWAASDQVGAGLFCTLTTALTFGYFISRGIAKASRVLEQ
jgi:peptidoglycan/LPS O-acetylase OafA/YrhL